MTSQYALDIVIAVLVLGYIMWRQTQWRVVDHGKMWRLPIILGIIGVVAIGQSDTAAAGFTPLAIAVLVVEGALAVIVGVWMGGLSQFARNEHGDLVARTGAAGSMLWLLLIAVRIALDVAAVNMGAKVVASGGVILLMLALNRLGRTAVLARRAETLPAQLTSSAAH
ncbi:hypothetical protein [Antrihabitans cavernicola]|uniref:DUF1453 domain-containing protein n=1 Tax=Antrihabitans cavernicola TaxID=2495913 RepID=A0A5A7S5P6_9NOCA|nr:hypothetical protein [Spelaeibacter cavernicola]KAA0021196.1 hypothetical protein FOY51_20005 [Spelaeibacter cavernicola]